MLVGARASPLSQAQIQEVQREIDFKLEAILVESRGDKDLKTSLRDLPKDDFFTREIDEMLLQGKCRIAIHSAKDLPEILPKGLMMIALTRGVDPTDVLVLREGVQIESLSSGARIATSSERRETAVRQLRSDLTFVDIRGTIGRRLAQLEIEVDGVVVAEAALIRLGLTHLNRVVLPGETTPLQGQLAILAREGDKEAQSLFAPLDTRKHQLHVGLRAPIPHHSIKQTHFPLIQILPRQKIQEDIQWALQEFSKFTHLIFGSQIAVELFLSLQPDVQGKIALAVGNATAQCLINKGFAEVLVAEQEQTEGIIELLKLLDLKNAYILWPHSLLSRPLLKTYLEKQRIHHHSCMLYDTVSVKNPPSLHCVDEIFFTSPSTVEAFASHFSAIPQGVVVHCIGPITQARFNALFC